MNNYCYLLAAVVCLVLLAVDRHARSMDEELFEAAKRDSRRTIPFQVYANGGNLDACANYYERFTHSDKITIFVLDKNDQAVPSTITWKKEGSTLVIDPETASSEYRFENGVFTVEQLVQEGEFDLAFTFSHKFTLCVVGGYLDTFGLDENIFTRVSPLGLPAVSSVLLKSLES